MAEKFVSMDDNETSCKQYAIPSNEEVINELTKNLECASIKSAEENDGKVYKCDRTQLDQEGNNVSCSEEEVINKFAAGVSENESENEENQEEDENDFIDEEALKDLEITYSVDDKEVLNFLCLCLVVLDWNSE
jgi:hypothetical protein